VSDARATEAVVGFGFDWQAQLPPHVAQLQWPLAGRRILSRIQAIFVTAAAGVNRHAIFSTMGGRPLFVAAACCLCAVVSGAPIRPPVEDFTADELERGIRCVEQRCDVQGAIADKTARWLRDGRHAASFARIQPVLDRVDGVKLYAIRPGSLFARIGFRNGDIVLAVDGLSLRAARIRETLESVSARRRHSVAIERDGVSVPLEITIVPTTDAR
jgi:hypothetical protein